MIYEKNLSLHEAGLVILQDTSLSDFERAFALIDLLRESFDGEIEVSGDDEVDEEDEKYFENFTFQINMEKVAESMALSRELEPLLKTERGKQALRELEKCQQVGPEGCAMRSAIIARLKS